MIERLVVYLSKAEQLSLFGRKTTTPAPTHVETRTVAAHTAHTEHGTVQVAAHTTHVHVAPTSAPVKRSKASLKRQTMIVAPPNLEPVNDSLVPDFHADEVPPVPGSDPKGTTYIVGVEGEIWTGGPHGTVWGHVIDPSGKVWEARAAVEEFKKRGARILRLENSRPSSVRERAHANAPLLLVKDEPFQWSEAQLEATRISHQPNPDHLFDQLAAKDQAPAPTPSPGQEAVRWATYKHLGTTDEVTTCELCGRDELKHTVALEDAHGNVVHYGSDCAARALKTTTKEIDRGAKEADDAIEEAERQARNAAHAGHGDGWKEFLVRETGGIRDFMGDLDVFKMVEKLGGFAAARRLQESKAAPLTPAEEWQRGMEDAARRAGLPTRYTMVARDATGTVRTYREFNVPMGLDALRTRVKDTAGDKAKVSALVDEVAATIASPGEDPAAVRAEFEANVGRIGVRAKPHIKLLWTALQHYEGNASPSRAAAQLAALQLFAKHFPLHAADLNKGAPMPTMPRPGGAKPKAPAAPPDPAMNPGPHGAIPPTPGQRVKFKHPSTGEETEGHIHGNPGGQGATIVDGTGATHRVPHGQYMHVHDTGAGQGDGAPKPEADLVKKAALKHLELGPNAPLAVYGAAALLSIGGVKTAHELKSEDVQVSGGKVQVKPDELETDLAPLVAMVQQLQQVTRRGPLFQVNGQPITEQALTAYVRRFGINNTAGPAPTTPAPMAKASPGAMVLPVQQGDAEVAWQMGPFLCEYRKGSDGLGMISIEGGGLPIPLHEIVNNLASAKRFAAEQVPRLHRGEAPTRGVFQAVASR